MLVAASSSFKANTTPFNTEQTIFKKPLPFFLFCHHLIHTNGLGKKKIIRLTKSASSDTLDIYRSAEPTINFLMSQSNQNKPTSTDGKQGLSYTKCTQVATRNLWINNPLNFLLWASVATLITIKVNTRNTTAFELPKLSLRSHTLQRRTTFLDCTALNHPRETQKLCQSQC